MVAQSIISGTRAFTSARLPHCHYQHSHYTPPPPYHHIISYHAYPSLIIYSCFDMDMYPNSSLCIVHQRTTTEIPRGVYISIHPTIPTHATGIPYRYVHGTSSTYLTHAHYDYSTYHTDIGTGFTIHSIHGY
jgi:hypothetical protein